MGETSVPYISSRWLWISRTVMPRLSPKNGVLVWLRLMGARVFVVMLVRHSLSMDSPGAKKRWRLLSIDWWKQESWSESILTEWVKFNNQSLSGPLFSNPTLSPNTVVLQFSPRNDLCGLGEHCFNFHILNRISRLFGLNHPTDQKVLLFGDGFDRSPLGQQQFFGVQRV